MGLKRTRAGVFSRQKSLDRTMEDFQKQALTEHLAELRQCLLHSLIAVGVGFAVSYSVSKEIGEWLFRPLFEVLPDQGSLIFISYQEGFFFT